MGNVVIDPGSELRVDRSTVRDPNARLLAAALGEALARGSPWLAIHKRVLARVATSTATQKDRHFPTGEVPQ